MIVYDVVLLPPENTANNAIKVSEQLAEEGSKLTLNEHDALPHLSLFMANFTPENLAVAKTRLAGIAASAKSTSLTALTYAHDVEQGMFEITYQNTSDATTLQTAVIAQLSPLRSGFREQDPVGRALAEYISQTSGELRFNLDTYGYDEVGSFFRPHITLTRFMQYNHLADTLALPSVETFSTVFTTLALCEMGDNGTCIREVARWDLIQ